MTGWRSFDVDHINYVINHPDCIKGATLGKGPVDASILVNNPDNYCLFDEHGGFVLVKESEGHYSAHTQFLKSGRGPETVRKAREAVQWMFKNTPCKVISTFCANDNAAARLLTLRAGFRPTGPSRMLDVDGTEYQITKPES